MGLFIVVAIGFYFLPSIIAWNKKDSGAIIAINLFLGWTFIGWIIALIWALTSPPALSFIVVQQPPYAPPSQGLYCSHCGKYSLPGAAFCSSCGRRMA